MGLCGWSYNLVMLIENTIDIALDAIETGNKGLEVALEAGKKDINDDT